jgi:Protein of unknown function (DUF3617)
MSSKWALVALLVIVGAGIGIARADDAIKPGKWQYTTTMQMPNMPSLHSGAQLPPNVQMRSGPGGMTVTSTRCVKSSDPATAFKGLHAGEKVLIMAGAHCTTDRSDRSGDTMAWAVTCSMPAGFTIHIEGTVHYDVDDMEADVKNRIPLSQGAPIERTTHVSGRYLGPCDGN